MKLKIFFGVLLFFILLSLIGAFIAYRSYENFFEKPVSTSQEIYNLKSGSTAITVINDLIANPIDRQVAKFYLHYTHRYTAILSGEYMILNKSLDAILKDMQKGNVVIKSYPTFAVVEGTNYERIMKKISEHSATLKDPEFFASITNPKTFLKTILKEHQDLLALVGDKIQSLEGLISPATYPMYEKEPFLSMFRLAIVKQLQILKEEWESRDDDCILKTPYEAMILASIIERETLVEDEREYVAAVFHNRLVKKMRLQTDPTVMYGIDPLFSGRLKKSDLQSDSPYNTYTRDGLPPTPICMPRAESIHAAIHPANSDVLYFVARDISPKDGHVFSGTLQEHNKAVAEYRKKVKEYNNSRKDADKTSDNKADTVVDKSKTKDKKDAKKAKK